MVANSAMFGLFDSGGMDVTAVSAYIDGLPNGLGELYCHPGSHSWTEDHPMPARYRPVDEFHALIDPAIIEMVRNGAIRLTTFGREAA
jgi:hypothetical protein